jgi:type I restriction enzyme, S subunit
MKRLVTIEEACEIVTDGTHYTPNDAGIGIPFLTVKDVKDSELDFVNCSFITTEDFNVAKEGNSAPQKGDVLFSKDGTVGKVHVVATDRPFAILSSLAILRPKQNIVDAIYLGHVLRSPSVLEDALKRKTGSAIRRIILSDLKKVKIPLPSLEEQKKIANILDRAEALRAKRRAALSQIDELNQSIFVEMFGEYAAKEWPMTTIANLAHPKKGSIRTGPFGSQLLHSEFVDEGVAVLGIDNAVANEFQWGTRRFINESKYKELKRYTVHPGDVLITIMGTCGRCAVVPDDIPVAINTKHLCCITLNQEKCIPTYLHAYFLRHPIAQRYLAQTAKGAIMAGLNMEIIKEMPIPLPPLSLQKEFARRAEVVKKLKAVHKASLAELDELFASLQYRAFRGEL